jgi:uncharacterized membrane protein YccC
MLEKVNRFFKSLDFLKGIVMAIAILIPVFYSSYVLNDIHIGLSIALGVIFCSPTDVPGSNRHVFLGILTAIFLSFGLTLLIGSVASHFWLLLPVLAFSVFLVSYISVFGFRATLITFVGLLAIVLSFTKDYKQESLWEHASLIALGGFWYLLLTYIKTLLFPKFQIDQLFIKTLEKTSEYLKIRSQLLVTNDDRNELYKKLFDLQIEINETHEIIRSIILSSRSNAGFSNKTRRQQLIFFELVDILELAIANPVDYEKVDEVFGKHKEKLVEFQKLINEMANQLMHISKVIRKEAKLTQNTKIPEYFKTITRNIDLYRILVGMPKARVGTLMMLNFKNYQEKQAQNIISIERVLNNYTQSDKIISNKDAGRFITPVDYDIKKLTENISFKSPIFKHSLRLALVVVIGYCIGIALKMQNPYWILITIIVIMRPSFGLTKSRSIQRVLGTLIGAAIATIVILLTQNTTVYAVIATVSLPFAFSFLQLNYRNAAVFITLNVIFLFAIFEPNILSVIQYRIIDTLIGASLSFLGMYFLLPSWQVENIHEYFCKAIDSNKLFMKEIALFYHKKGQISTKYKLLRKEAFLNIAELNAVFQRLNQDPKSKQSDLSIIYEMIVFNNTFLSSLTSLGTFIRDNKTSEAPAEFDIFIKNICLNLDQAINILENSNKATNDLKVSIGEAENSYQQTFMQLSNKRDEEIALGEEHSIETGSLLKETLLVFEQLKWLNNLSEKLISASKHYNSKVRTLTQ